VLQMTEVERPVPAEGQVLIKVHATTVNRTDAATRAGTPWVARMVMGVRRPNQRILGSEFAGTVEALGPGAGELKVGDRVFGVNVGHFRGVRLEGGYGAHAEFVCVPERGAIGLMPKGVSFEDAAAVCDGAILALNCLRPAGVQAGQDVLIYGASGSIGTASVQLAKHFGARVTAVCNTKNVDLVRSLGADEVIDYLKDDFTKNGKLYDLIVDAVGKHSFSRCRGSLKAAGVYAPTDGLLNIIRASMTRRSTGKRVVFALPPHYTKEAVLLIKGLMEAGTYRAVIDRTYPLDQVVEASRYVETQQKTGNVVLTV